MTKVGQSNLSGGEVSEAIAARVDIDKYKTSVYKAENFFVQIHGGLTNRPGLEYVAPSKTPSTSVRLIPFEFNTTQTYILEFGNLYMRVYKDGGQVLTGSAKVISAVTRANPAVVTSSSHGFSNDDDVFITGVVGMTELNSRFFRVASATTHTFALTDYAGANINSGAFTVYGSAGTAQEVFELTTPYATADIFGLQYVQSADVLTVTHPNYAPRDIARTDHDAWSLTEIDFKPEQAFPTGLGVTVNSTGSETERYVVTATNVDSGEESLRGTAPAVGSGITAITKADPGVVTTSGSHGLVNGDDVYISGVVGMTEANGQVFKVANKASTTFELTDSTGAAVNTTSYTTYSSGGSVFPMFIKITNGHATPDNTVAWTAVSGAESYTVYREKNGLFGFVGRTENTDFDDKNIGPEVDDTPPRTRNPFVGTGNYPSTVGYHEQRKLFGNSDTHTQRVWMTQTAHFTNLAVSSPTRDDDAITVTLASRQVNEIRHYVSLSDLVVLTSGGEWLVQGVDGVITPSGIQIKPQSYYGSTELPPIVAGDIVIYMQPGQAVRDLGYKFESDSYTGNDLSVLARHLFDNNTIVDWTYAQAPHSLLWCVRDDGVLLGMTYSREQNVFGWHRHTTKGDFKSAAAIREGDDDFTYCVIDRVVGGATVKYIERMRTRDISDVQDSYFVDSGLTLDTPVAITGFTNANPVVVTAASHGFSNGDVVDITGVKVADSTATRGWSYDTEIEGTGYTVAGATTHTFQLQNNGANVNGSAFKVYSSAGVVRKAVTTVGGMWHLEGQSVVALANGYVVRSLTVSSGSVTLPSPASRVHVGLPYTSEMQSLRVDNGKAVETIQGRDKKIGRLTMRFETTLGGWYGPDRDHMREIKYGLSAQYGQPPAWVTGDKGVTMSPSWNKDGYVIVQQRDPLPMNLLALIPDVVVGGN
tara:strand:- start:2465 stop:5254 length:2790 start_codon:yes stop_codon:yes gene_type:complete